MGFNVVLLIVSVVLFILIILYSGYRAGKGRRFYLREDKRVLRARDKIVIRSKLNAESLIVPPEVYAKVYLCEFCNNSPGGRIAVFWTRKEYLQIGEFYEIKKNKTGISFHEDSEK